MNEVQPGQPLDQNISATAWNLARDLARMHAEGVLIRGRRNYFSTQALPRQGIQRWDSLMPVPLQPGEHLVYFAGGTPSAPEDAFLDEACTKLGDSGVFSSPFILAFDGSVHLMVFYGMVAAPRCGVTPLSNVAWHDDPTSWTRGHPYWHACRMPLQGYNTDAATHLMIAHSPWPDPSLSGVDAIKVGSTCTGKHDLVNPRMSACNTLFLPRYICIYGSSGCDQHFSLCSMQVVFPHPDDFYALSPSPPLEVTEATCSLWSLLDPARNIWHGPIVVPRYGNWTLYRGLPLGNDPVCTQRRCEIGAVGYALQIHNLSIALCPGTAPEVVGEVPIYMDWPTRKISYDIGAPVINETDGTVRVRVIADARIWCDTQSRPQMRLCIRELCFRYRCDVIPSMPGRWYEP